MSLLAQLEKRYNPRSKTNQQMQELLLQVAPPADIAKHLKTVQARLKKDRSQELAELVLAVYAPLANRLNLQNRKKELENEAFSILHPAQYQLTVKMLRRNKAETEKEVIRFIGNLKKLLYDHNIAVHDVTGRTKQPYSLYKKLNKKGSAAGIHDLFAVRVITADNAACYEVLDVLHKNFEPDLNRFKDYIDQPKPNGYRSLHTTIKSGKKTVEVQIRTKDMDDEAESGAAAHWHYDRHKDTKGYVKGRAADKVAGPATGSVYVFSPTGDVYKLPSGATPLDFAFAVHTSIGLRTMGAKVNGRMVKLNQPLQTADQVEIITGSAAKPKRDWLKIVQSSRAKNRINTWLKQAERDRYLDVGRQKLLEVFDGEMPKNLKAALEHYKLASEDDLLVALGAGYIHESTIKRYLTKPDKPSKAKATIHPEAAGPTKRGVRISGMDGLQFRIAGCCKPEPPKPICGYITRSLGITIHKQGCVHAKGEAERLLVAEWSRPG